MLKYPKVVKEAVEADDSIVRGGGVATKGEHSCFPILAIFLGTPLQEQFGNLEQGDE